MMRSIVACSVGLAISSVAAHAHHAIQAVYDSSRQATIDGVVSQFQFINPHPFVTIDVKRDAGKTQQWRLELDNRYELVQIGMTSDTLKPGDRIVVTGSLARAAQSNELYVLRLDRPADGFGDEQGGSSPKIRTRPEGPPPRLLRSYRGTCWVGWDLSHPARRSPWPTSAAAHRESGSC